MNSVINKTMQKKVTGGIRTLSELAKRNLSTTLLHERLVHEAQTLKDISPLQLKLRDLNLVDLETGGYIQLPDKKLAYVAGIENRTEKNAADIQLPLGSIEDTEFRKRALGATGIPFFSIHQIGNDVRLNTFGSLIRCPTLQPFYEHFTLTPELMTNRGRVDFALGHNRYKIRLEYKMKGGIE